MYCKQKEGSCWLSPMSILLNTLLFWAERASQWMMRDHPPSLSNKSKIWRGCLASAARRMWRLESLEPSACAKQHKSRGVNENQLCCAVDWMRINCKEWIEWGWIYCGINHPSLSCWRTPSANSVHQPNQSENSILLILNKLAVWDSFLLLWTLCSDSLLTLNKTGCSEQLPAHLVWNSSCLSQTSCLFWAASSSEPLVLTHFLFWTSYSAQRPSLNI